jgi:hypothetical protein
MEKLRANLLSPQFVQALNALTSAARSDNIEMILMSCGLDSSLMAESPDGV